MKQSPISLKSYLERVGRLDEKCVECGTPLFYDIDDVQVYDRPDGKMLYKGQMPIHLKWLNDIPIGNHIYHRNVCWKCLFNDIRDACKKQMWKTVYIKGWPKEVIEGKEAFPPRAMRAIGRRLLPLIFRGACEEDIKKNSSRYDAASINSFIKRYGEDEGCRRYDEYVAFQSAKNTYEYKRDHKGWTKEQFDEYNKARAVTVENLQRRYGEREGKERFNAYCKWQAYAGCALEYFQELYGIEDGKQKYLELNRQKARSLENFINKYGDVEGQKRWNEWYEKARQHGFFVIKEILKRPYSKVSQKLFNSIVNELSESDRLNCHFATHNGELRIHLSNGQVVLPDFILDKKIIEFNGDFWHRNPELYKDDLVTEDVKLVWEKDKNRLSEYEKLGYSVLVVWELEYNREPEVVLKRCLDFLHENCLG